MAMLMPTIEELAALERLAERFPFLFPRPSLMTVGELVAKYLDDVKGELDPHSFERKKGYLNAFVNDFGDRLVESLGPLDGKTFFSSRPKWASPWTRFGARAHILACLNWAVQMRLIRDNPLKGLDAKTSGKKNGRDVTPDEFQVLLRFSDLTFRQLLVALKFTGARPGELRRLKWEHIDWGKGLAILDEHKSSKKTGRPRVIVLVPNMVKLLTIIRRDQHPRPVVVCPGIQPRATGCRRRAKLESRRLPVCRVQGRQDGRSRD